jgi:hypothetical protein
MSFNIMITYLDCEYVKEITVLHTDPVIHYDIDGVRIKITKPVAHVVFDTRFENSESWVLEIAAAAIGHDHLICHWQEWRGMTEHGYEEHTLGHQAELLNTIRGDKISPLSTQISSISL